MKPEPKTQMSRRELFQGFRKKSMPAAKCKPEILPWSFDRSILENCTGCGDCVATCPESIIRISENNRATVDFQQGECIFCGECADVCREDVFLSQESRKDIPPWQAQITIAKTCLAFEGIVCQVCRDQCLERVISFPPIMGATALPKLDVDSCTGCGACVSSCPTAAITIQIQNAETNHPKIMKVGA